jgi:hypothetical protein
VRVQLRKTVVEHLSILRRAVARAASAYPDPR